MRFDDMEDLPLDEKNSPSYAENEAEEVPIQFEIEDFFHMCEVF